MFFKRQEEAYDARHGRQPLTSGQGGGRRGSHGTAAWPGRRRNRGGPGRRPGKEPHGGNRGSPAGRFCGKRNGRRKPQNERSEFRARRGCQTGGPAHGARGHAHVRRGTGACLGCARDVDRHTPFLPVCPVCMGALGAGGPGEVPLYTAHGCDFVLGCGHCVAVREAGWPGQLEEEAGGC